MLRRRLKKLTAMVRGTTPMRKGWLMARPMTEAIMNCQEAFTPPIATMDIPRTITPTGINHRGPKRSANRPAKGPNTPDIHTPQLEASPMWVRGQLVSSMMKLCTPPSTTPATAVATNAPVADRPSTSQP